MIDRETFQYFIFDETKKALYVDANGQIQWADDNFMKPDGTPARLSYSPQGWPDTLIKYARNTKYWGVFRSYTTPMGFPMDGYRILKYLQGLKGYEAIAYFGIAKLDRLDLPYKYKNFYLSELNFVKSKQQLSFFNIEALEGGVIKLLKANEGTVYDIDLDDDAEAKNIFFDGIKFNFSQTWITETDMGIRGDENYFTGIFRVQNEGNPVNEFFQDLTLSLTAAYPNDLWFYRTDKNQDVKISIKDFQIFYNKTVSAILRVDLVDGAGGVVSSHDLIDFGTGAGNAGETKYFNTSVSITVPAGHRLHMKSFGGSPIDHDVQYTIHTGDVIMEYPYQHESSYVKGIYLHRLFTKLLEKITEGQFSFSSNWLLNKKDILITSGDGLRKIDGAKIKISWNDAFKSLPFAGMGVDENGNLFIEEIDFFFKDEVSMDLGVVDECELTVAEDLIGNLIKAGYEKKDYTDVNGKNEPNQGQVWSTPVKKVIKEIDLVSPIRADAIGAEITRINFEKKITTDSEGDNDTWMINVETVEQVDVNDVHYYALYHPGYSAVTGLDQWETYFNLELTPHKTLIKWSPYLESLWDKMIGKFLKMESGDKNTVLSTTLAGVTVKEDEPIQITGNGRLFQPYYWTFKTQLSTNTFDLLNEFPYHKIQFTWKDKVWKGYLWDGGVKPADNEVQQWKVLVSKDNDLSKFGTL